MNSQDVSKQSQEPTQSPSRTDGWVPKPKKTGKPS